MSRPPRLTRACFGLSVPRLRGSVRGFRTWHHAITHTLAHLVLGSRSVSSQWQACFYPTQLLPEGYYHADSGLPLLLVPSGEPLRVMRQEPNAYPGGTEYM